MRGIKMELKKEHWTKQDYQEFLDYLKSNSDERYKKFHSSLVPNLKDFYGCRVPFLKKAGKEISKGNYQEFLKLNPKKRYEEKFVYGMVISSVKMDFNERLDYLRKFIPIIDNWAICDSFCAILKDFKKNSEEGFNFIQELLKKEDTYTLRVALVLLLDHYINENYLHSIFKITDEIKSDEYYVNMAIAWLISTCYIKYPKETLKYLKHNNLDPWTYNKSISKICESLRVSKEDKQTLHKLKTN